MNLQYQRYVPPSILRPQSFGIQWAYTDSYEGFACPMRWLPAGKYPWAGSAWEPKLVFFSFRRILEAMELAGVTSQG